MTRPPSVIARPFVATLEEPLSVSNISEWVEKRLREIEIRYNNAVDNEETTARINAEMRQVAMVVESVTGHKPDWSVAIETHYRPTLYLTSAQPACGSRDKCRSE